MLEALFGITIPGDLPPRYNIAPGQPVAAVRPNAGGGGDAGGGRELTLFQWGLIPSWSKDPAIGSRMINARAETAAEKPSFRAAMKRRRCLIPASGFYEWAKAGPAKQPYFFHMKDNRPFALAGLWERWLSEDGSELETCAILTTSPNALVENIHQRMPVIIAPEDYDPWLDPANEKPATLQHLLRPFPAEEMETIPVSCRVNDPKNDDPACVEAAGASESTVGGAPPEPAQPAGDEAPAEGGTPPGGQLSLPDLGES
jgi:putative SOS response-associated peptidase YedK